MTTTHRPKIDGISIEHQFMATWRTLGSQRLFYFFNHSVYATTKGIIVLYIRKIGQLPKILSWQGRNFLGNCSFKRRHRKERKMPGGEDSIRGLSVTFTAVTRHHSGHYLCSADNGFGQPSVANLKLDVQRKSDLSRKWALLVVSFWTWLPLALITYG